MNPDRIERSTTIDAPIERVWSLLTEAEHLGSWFGSAATIDLRPGGELTLRWDEPDTSAWGQVETVEPPHRFAFRWGPSNPSEREGRITLVEFTLDGDERSTRLTVVESGFDAYGRDDDERAAKHEDNTEGWAIILRQFTEHAARVAA